MKLKFLWPLFIVVSFILVPVKIFASFTGSGFDKSTEFFIISMIAMISFFVFAFFYSKHNLKTYEINKNPYLGISSLLVGSSFIWYTVGLITSHTSSDAFFQNLFSLVFAIASGIAFLFIALSYFFGKNKISQIPVLIFFPIFWYVSKMVSFLSISDSTPDQYEVAMCSFILLFLLNQIKIFVKIPGGKNTIKKLLMFGFPAVVTSLMFCIPEISSEIQSFSDTMNPISLSSLFIQITVSIYICFTLINIRSQMELD